MGSVYEEQGCLKVGDILTSMTRIRKNIKNIFESYQKILN